MRMRLVRAQRRELALTQGALRLAHLRDLALELHDLGRSRLELGLQQLDARLPAVVGHLQPEDALARPLQGLLLVRVRVGVRVRVRVGVRVRVRVRV